MSDAITPRVHADIEIDAYESGPFGVTSHTTPYVRVEVDFDYGDHLAVLVALERATSAIRSRITGAVTKASETTMRA